MPTATLNPTSVAQRDHIADLILALAVYRGREGAAVTDEDRDGADYADCQTAADAILELLDAPATGPTPISATRQEVAAALWRQAEHEEDRARGALAVAVPAVDRDPEVQNY